MKDAKKGSVAEGVSKCDFAMSRDVACRVSMSATTYKIIQYQ